MSIPTSQRYHMASVDRTELSRGSQGQLLATMIDQNIIGEPCAFSDGWIYMPPGKVTQWHVHNTHEIHVFVIKGYAVSLVGDDLEPYFHRPGDTLRIPAGVPHAAVNLSSSHEVYAWETRGVSRFDDDTVPLYSEVGDKAELVANELRVQHADDIMKWERSTILEMFQFAIDCTSS